MKDLDSLPRDSNEPSQFRCAGPGLIFDVSPARLPPTLSALKVAEGCYSRWLRVGSSWRTPLRIKVRVDEGPFKACQPRPGFLDLLSHTAILEWIECDL